MASCVNYAGGCGVITGGIGGACGSVCAIAVMLWIAGVALFCAATTASWTPHGLATLWTVVKWCAITCASGVGLALIGMSVLGSAGRG